MNPGPLPDPAAAGGPARGGPSGAADAFLALPLGTRVVVRYRVGAAATDALGALLRRTDGECDIATRRGTVTVRLADILAAKQVPLPPPRRRRSLSRGGSTGRAREN